MLTSEPIPWAMIETLQAQGLERETLAMMASLRIVHGECGATGHFELRPDGLPFIAFVETDDVVLWNPDGGELATWTGRAFALGEDNIVNAATYAFDCALHVHRDPLSWLQDRARGIVVLDWRRAFDMLRDAPRIAIGEGLLPLYRRHMRCPLPEIEVVDALGRVVAA